MIFPSLNVDLFFKSAGTALIGVSRLQEALSQVE
jgi:hypothetical protein